MTGSSPAGGSLEIRLQPPDAAWPDDADYATKTTRTIPLFVLEQNADHLPCDFLGGIQSAQHIVRNLFILNCVMCSLEGSQCVQCLYGNLPDARLLN